MKLILKYFDYFVMFFIACFFHILYSNLGYNPTDDGWLLAFSKRIYLGQIPHLDFISVRPAGSPLLHLPTLLFAQENLYIFSRFIVWIQFVTINFIWIKIIFQNPNTKISKKNIISLAIISTMLSAHTFPIMVWTTIDGVFCSLIGLFIIIRIQKYKTIGYFFIGFAYLCKQSFLLLPFVILWALRDWQKKKYIFSVLLPGLIYFSMLAITGAFNDFIIQLTSNNESSLLFNITLNYFYDNGSWHTNYCEYSLLGFIFSFILITIKNNGLQKRNSATIILLLVILFLTFIIFFRQIYLSNFHALGFFLFGLNLGIIIHETIYNKDNHNMPFYIISLFLAWSVSLSMGYRYPSLVNGLLFCNILHYSVKIISLKNLRFNLDYISKKRMIFFGILLIIISSTFNEYLLTYLLSKDQSISNIFKSIIWILNLSGIIIGITIIIISNSKIKFIDIRKYSFIGSFLFVIIIAHFFHNSRLNKIYLELPADKLNYSLSNIFPGGNGIFTNKNIYDLLLELKDIVASNDNKLYAIIPDIAGYWPSANQENYLSADWIQKREVPTKKYLEQIKSDIFNLTDNSGVIILQKYKLDCFFSCMCEQNPNLPIYTFIKDNFQKIKETKFYWIYKKKEMLPISTQNIK